MSLIHLVIGGVSMDHLIELKKEIEAQKNQLIKLLESDESIDEILKLNYRIDELIVDFYRLQKESKIAK